MNAPRQRGFSLLEVLVAFSILALSLGVLIQVYSSALTATFLGGEYSRAAALAQSRLNGVGIDVPLEAGSHGGGPEDGLWWRVIIEPYELVDVSWEPALDAYKVTAIASWGGEDGERRQVSITTLRLSGEAEQLGPASPGAPESPSPRQVEGEP